jgi:starch phosphorylase
VWLNTPLRPLEASGTSGMKAVANGALHLSVLDGWWAEAYQPGFGWAIGDGSVSSDPDTQDIIDSDALYTLLEDEVVPGFYDRDAAGLPRAWIEKMKGSIAAYAPTFNTNRMVAEYGARAYAPAAASFANLKADGGARARALAAWIARVRAGWESVKVFAVDDNATPVIGGTHPPITVRVALHPGALAQTDFGVDIVSGIADPQGTLTTGAVTPATFEGAGEDGLCRFTATFAPETPGRGGYAVRIRPSHPDLYDPYQTGLVLWA